MPSKTEGQPQEQSSSISWEKLTLYGPLGPHSFLISVSRDINKEATSHSGFLPS